MGIGRRRFISTLGGAALPLWTLAACVQKSAMIGFVSPGAREAYANVVPILTLTLRCANDAA